MRFRSFSAILSVTFLVMYCCKKSKLFHKWVSRVTNSTFLITSFLSVILFITCNIDTVTNDDSGVISTPVELPRYDFDNPVWHPNGRWIAVHHTDSIDTDEDGVIDTLLPGIWLVDAETGEKQPLLGNGFYRPSWSPDGSMLAVEGNNFQIFTLEMASLEPPRIDTTTIRQLTFEARSFSAAWSSDGQWIAYRRTNCEGPSTCGTWLMDTEGNQKRFLFLGVSSLGISWHPFDPLILYTRRVWAEDGAALGDTVELFDICTNTHRSIRFLSEPNYSNYDIHYSPDGRKIAFVSVPRGGPPATIWIMNSDGTHLRQLTGGWEWGLSFSPDGKQIVFPRRNPYEPIPGNGELWVIDTSGTNLRQLTFSAWE